MDPEIKHDNINYNSNCLINDNILEYYYVQKNNVNDCLNCALNNV